MEWIRENPAEFAWLLFAILTAIVAAYRRVEDKLKAWAGRSETQLDDQIIGGVSHLLALITVVLDFATYLVPAFATRWRKAPK